MTSVQSTSLIDYGIVLGKIFWFKPRSDLDRNIVVFWDADAYDDAQSTLFFTVFS